MNFSKQQQHNIIKTLFGNSYIVALEADGIINGGSTIDGIIDLFISSYSIKFGNVDDMSEIVKESLMEEFSERVSAFESVENKEAKEFVESQIKEKLCGIYNQSFSENWFDSTIADAMKDKNKIFYQVFMKDGVFSKNYIKDSNFVYVFVDWGETFFYFDELLSNKAIDGNIIIEGIKKFNLQCSHTTNK